MEIPLQKECILLNPFGSLEAQTVDMSKMGLGVKTDRTLPFINVFELGVFIPGMHNPPQAELMWTKKDINNTTRLGLKLYTSLTD